MPRLPSSTPKYRKHRASGQAVVNIAGRDHYLGPWRSKASLVEYGRLIAEWLASGRQALITIDGPDSVTVSEVLALYWQFAKRHCRKGGKTASELSECRYSMRPVRRLYGHTLARGFGPLALKSVRQTMVDSGWCRGTVNRQIDRVKRVFKWAVSEEFVPPAVHQGLATVAGLQRGRMPTGKIEQQHPAEQIPADVKIASSPRTVVRLVRAVLAAFPDARRVGVLAHKKHLPVIQGTAKKKPVLDRLLRSRIARAEHFRSGLSRGSNRWTAECDLIVVLGTPRVPPTAVKTRLIQRGWTTAAARDGGWERDYWSGLTTAGRRVTIRTSAYRDHDWHLAHQALVRSELIQAVGRGRGICANGVPVVVLSDDDLGLPISEKDVEEMTEEEVKALGAIAAIRL